MAIDVSPRLLKRRRTKIISTIGPATQEPDTIAQLIEAGVDVFRLNMSHGDAAAHRAAAGRVRAAAAAAGEPVALIADLCGPKIRTGVFPGGEITLPHGGLVRVTGREVGGRQGFVPVGYSRLSHDVQIGHRLLLDDGRLALEVESADGEELVCRVQHGGRLSDRKGVNFPDSELSISALTDKDRVDTALAVELGVDLIALSFVRSGRDIEQLRELVREHGAATRLIAKIEKPEALNNIEGIIRAADAIMVARGDLGVEMPAEQVPGAQDELVSLARARHKPVIIATQMLESMLTSARPTRAEVSDIAHAVGSGTDAVMLSAETAVGDHPVGAVEIMDRIIRQTEARLWVGSAFHALTEDDEVTRPLQSNEAVGRAVSQLSRDLGVRAILVVSRSGMSGMVVSSSRPAAPLIAATAEAGTQRLMNLFWGVVPILVEPIRMDDAVPLLRELAGRLELAEAGCSALIVRGFRDEADDNLPSVTVVRL